MYNLLINLFVVTIILVVCQQANGNTKCDIEYPISTHTAVIDGYKKDYAIITESTSKWQRIANIIWVMSFFVTFCGAVIAALQKGDGRAIKILVIFLGVLLALLNYTKDSLPDGNYKAYQQAILKADDIRIDLDHYFIGFDNSPINVENNKKTIVSVCERINEWRELNSSYSTTLPLIFDLIIRSSKADESISASGTGNTLIEAKSAAEDQGMREIKSQLESRIDKSISKPIFQSIKPGIVKASTIAVQKTSESYNFDEKKNEIKYAISYTIDDSILSNFTKGISFPLFIFSTKLIEPKIETLTRAFTSYGFDVTHRPAPRGPNSETNAIFVGPGVPIRAIAEIVEQLNKNSVPIKAIVYPWSFQRSKLPDSQKANHVQIGGSTAFEALSPLSEESLEKLKAIKSQADMVAFSKSFTDTLKDALGLAIDDDAAEGRPETKYELKAIKVATGNREYFGFGDELYKFSIFVKAPIDEMKRIKQVSYSFVRNGKDDFGNPIIGDDEQAGFIVSYAGWGCYTNVAVAIMLKDGRNELHSFNMCESIKGQ